MKAFVLNSQVDVKRDLLLTLVEDESSRMVVSRHADHHVPVEGPPPALVHGVACDGGRGVTGPVQTVPRSVIRQTLHRTHTCRREPDKIK